MKLAMATYVLGVILASLVGFFSPLWFLGFLPLSAGAIYAALDLMEVPGAEPPTPPQRTF